MPTEPDMHPPPNGPPQALRVVAIPPSKRTSPSDQSRTGSLNSSSRPSRLCGPLPYFNSTNDPTFGNAPTSGRAYSLNASLISFPFTMYDSSKCFVSRATVASGVRNVSI